VVTVKQYVDLEGQSRFGEWLDGLDDPAAARVLTAVTRIDFGPGLRVYFGKDGATVVILLGGGTKKRHARDIADAHRCWQDYKQRR
jgi:putative component of toxin-antitoxin plasmid stabilization module